MGIAGTSKRSKEILYDDAYRFIERFVNVLGDYVVESEMKESVTVRPPRF